MYVTKAINGVPAIQRDGQSVLSVCHQDWEFADWLCALLNELGPQVRIVAERADSEQCDRSAPWKKDRHNMPK